MSYSKNIENDMRFHCEKVCQNHGNCFYNDNIHDNNHIHNCNGNNYVYIPYYKVQQQKQNRFDQRLEEKFETQQSNKKTLIKQNLSKIDNELSEIKKKINYNEKYSQPKSASNRNNFGLYFPYGNKSSSRLQLNHYNNLYIDNENNKNYKSQFHNDLNNSHHISKTKIQNHVDDKQYTTNNKPKTNLSFSHFSIELICLGNNKTNELLQTIRDQEKMINNLMNNIIQLEEKVNSLESEKNLIKIKNANKEENKINIQYNQHLTDRTSTILLKNNKYSKKNIHKNTYDKNFDNNIDNNTNEQEVNQIENNNNNDIIILNEHCQTQRNNIETNDDMMNFLHADSPIQQQRFNTEPTQEIANTNTNNIKETKATNKPQNEQIKILPLKLNFNYASYLNGEPFTTLIKTNNK